MSAPAILALDVATTSGWAYGRPGEVPRSGTIRFAPAGSTNARVGCGALRWFTDFLKLNPVDAVFYEAPFDPRHMGGKTNFSTTRTLVGLPFLIDTMCEAKGIARLREVTVGDARKHFLGRGVRGDKGKDEVQQRCAQLGWRFDSPDAADACAVWSFACAVIAPDASVATAPLFRPADVFSPARDIEDIPE